MKRLFAAFSGDFLLIVVWLEKPAGALFDRSIYELPSTGLELLVVPKNIHKCDQILIEQHYLHSAQFVGYDKQHFS